MTEQNETDLDVDDLREAAIERLAFEVELGGPLLPRAEAAGGETAGEETGRAGVTAAGDDTLGEVISVSSASDGYPPAGALSARIPEGSPLHGMATLEQVADYVASTVLIPLDETRLNPVFGVGNPMADLMVIGEAPGADEDQKGEPFVGRAGQLLDKILKAIGFERGDVYIANILKSRPPQNRNPTPVEVEAHLPVLLKQILLIQPRLILCVGRTAGTSLLGIESSLSALRGRFHDFCGIPVVVTYHPAALLRNPNWKPATWEDVKMLRARYDELVGEGVPTRQ